MKIKGTVCGNRLTMGNTTEKRLGTTPQVISPMLLRVPKRGQHIIVPVAYIPEHS